MSQENVEIVRRLFAAFQSVDVGNFERSFDEVREIFDPEVDWVAAPHSLLASEEYRGYDGVRRFWTQFLLAWDDYGVRVDELIDTTTPSKPPAAGVDPNGTPAERGSSWSSRKGAVSTRHAV